MLHCRQNAALWFGTLRYTYQRKGLQLASVLNRVCMVLLPCTLQLQASIVHLKICRALLRQPAVQFVGGSFLFSRGLERCFG